MKGVGFANLPDSRLGLASRKKLDGTGKFGVLMENVIRLVFVKCVRVTVRAEQDRLHPNLPGSMDVAKVVVSNENRLFRADLQLGQSRLKEPMVGLAIAIVSRNNDGPEVVGKAGGPKFG